MKKSDLIDGMMVENEEGSKYLVLPSRELYNVKDEGWSPLINYDEDLKHNIYSFMNIVKVFERKEHDWNLLWERSNKIETMMSFNLQPLSLTVHNCKAILDDKKTTVILPDGTQASTVCLPEDDYMESLGMQIAFDKAMIKWFSKQLKCLNK